METAGYITIGVFMVTVTFYAGRLTARVEKLEEWRVEVRQEFAELRAMLLHMESLITGNER